ncbi:hypothetical protein ES702_05529 [subsurface metagenome]
MNYFLNRWEKKLLLVKCEIALKLNDEDLEDGNNLDLTYDMIDLLLDELNMSSYESSVLNDHITYMSALLNLNHPKQAFESAYQQTYYDMGFKGVFG